MLIPWNKYNDYSFFNQIELNLIINKFHIYSWEPCYIYVKRGSVCLGCYDVDGNYKMLIYAHFY